MSTFKNIPEIFKRIDYQIIANGWFQLYFSNGVLRSDITWLEKENYEIAEFSCRGLSNLFNQFNDYFHFPNYFWHNFNSFNDCLRDIEIKGIGLAIVLKHIDSLKKDVADILLDILVNMARLNFIVGKRVLIMAQVDDNKFRAEHIGAIEIRWNMKEFVNSTREENYTQQ